MSPHMWKLRATWSRSQAISFNGFRVQGFKSCSFRGSLLNTIFVKKFLVY